MFTKIHQVDSSIIKSVQKLPKEIRPLMIALTFIGEPLVLLSIVISLTVYMFINKQASVVKAGFATAVLLLVSPILKIIFQRSRPAVIFASINQPKSYSFPSGHAYMSMLVLGLLAYVAYARLQQPLGIIVAISLALIIFGIGLSRVYLGVHYASDVIAGWLVAFVLLVLIIKIFGV